MGNAAHRAAGPASPDHIPESAPIVLVQHQCQQPLVLALELDGVCPEGVCHCLQQRDSSCRSFVTHGPADFSYPDLWCVSSVQHMGSPDLFLHVTLSSDNPAGAASELLLSLGASVFLQFFPNLSSLILNTTWNAVASACQVIELPGHILYITGMFWWNFVSPDPSSVLDYIQNCLPGTETEGLERGHLPPAPKTQIRPYQLYHGIVWGGGRCRWKKSPLCTENLEQGVPALCIPKSCLASLESIQGQRHPSNL